MQQIRVLPRRALKKSEAAELLGIVESTIDRMIKEKRLRAIQLSPGCTRILLRDLEEFLAAHATIQISAQEVRL
jgi:excisionase family DNA binding protein